MSNRRMLHLYLLVSAKLEHCFNVQLSEALSDEKFGVLKRILADGFDETSISEESWLEADEKEIVEIGPRLNFASPFHSRLSSICRDCHVPNIERIERSVRHIVKDDKVPIFDRMTHMIYENPLQTFDTGIEVEEVYDIPLMEKGPDDLKELSGVSMDEWDRSFYYDYFVKKKGRNPTNVEMFDLNNANSEHSRHGFFRGQQVHNGVPREETLLEIIMSTLPKDGNSTIAFDDNSSAFKGPKCWTIMPADPGLPSEFAMKEVRYNPLFTAETHNFPTGIAPFPGAETGTGGRIRDVQATGRGGLVIAGTAGYCVGDLLIPGYNLPWEDSNNTFPDNLASSLHVYIDASNGASDYGNKFGESVIQGYCRSFDMRLSNGERWAWGKKIMFTGGVGQMDDRHTKKNEPEPGWIILQVGGPAYRVGFGGGAASSMLQGQNEAKLDDDAVQRGDAEMEQKMNRVVRACSEMGIGNIIEVIHDQGAGGPANVLKELVEKQGGWVEVREIVVGDITMSVVEIWVAEFQERTGIVVQPKDYAQLKAICDREKVSCEKLGEVTGDGIFTLRDRRDGSTPVEFDLAHLLGDIPQKTFEDASAPVPLKPLVIPDDADIEYLTELVLQHPDVCSKRFLTNKVDRSVTGLIRQQQCCGPMQLPLSDVAVVAQSHFASTGIAISIGEQPIKMLLDPAKGARMGFGESLTNLVWARLSSIDDVKASVNWMCAPKLPGEGVAMYEAALGTRDAMIQVGVGADGGKDSLSMAVLHNGETIKSPRETVFSLYGPVPDISKVVTPDIEMPGKSQLLFIDLAYGSCKLGGSVMARVIGQLGDNCPDMYRPKSFRAALDVVQDLVKGGIISAGHDISDGGFMQAILEMAFAGNCGFTVNVNSRQDAFHRMFAEELGLLIEIDPKDCDDVLGRFGEIGIPVQVLGSTHKERMVSVSCNNKLVLYKEMEVLRDKWEETSYQLEKLQSDPSCAAIESINIYSRENPEYVVSFTPKKPAVVTSEMRKRYKVAVLRDEGSNGDREMTSALYMAGLDPWDVTMTDILSGRVDLKMFRGLTAVGGFSYADYPSSAKGWAAVIRENPVASKMFRDFYARPDTFSLGICNGCQLFGLLGLVPWQGISDENQPRFVRNKSGRLESRWSMVRILGSPSIMLQGMEGSQLGIHGVHGEGRFHCPDELIFNQMNAKMLFPMAYCNDQGRFTEDYPFNPNGSVNGITAMCSEDGRHLAMMPHPERAFLKWQWHYLPKQQDKAWEASPWMQMFMNAFEWCVKTSD